MQSKLKLKIMFLLLFFTTTLFSDEVNLEKISVQLKWKNQFQFIGFYMAKEKGFYEQLGLDVDILEYTDEMDPVKEVLEGKSDYGVGYPSVILDKTEYKDIVLLSALLQSSPHVLISLKSSNIRTIEDFKNKKIMISNAATYTASFISMFASNGISMSDMQRLEPSFNINSLVNKETDLITGYRTNELYSLEKQGIDSNVWDPKDYGFDFYDDILFTSKKELRNHPDRVENFRVATLKGYEYAYANIDEAITLLIQNYNTQNRSKEALLYEANTLKKLAYKEKNAFGEIDPVKIQRILDIYNLFGHVKHKVNLDEFIYKPHSSFYITNEEKVHLLKIKSVKMCVDPDWMPFEKIENGLHVGMSADYFELIKAKLPIPIELVKTKTWEESITFLKERKCDITSLAMATPEREKYLKFTDPYLKTPLVMATKMDAPFVANFETLENKKIGIKKGYAFLEILRVQYPNLDIVEVNNLNEGLQAVVNDEIYGYIGTLGVIGYEFQKNFTGELKIAGKFDGSWDLGIGVRDDDEILYGVFQGIVQSIKEKEKQKIVNDWLSINYEQSINYSVLVQIVLGFVIVLMLLGFFYFRERKFKKNLEINQIFLEAIINNIPNPMFYKDKFEVFQNVNDAFSKNILGLQKEQIIGKTLQGLNGLIAPQMLDDYKQENEIFSKIGSSDEYEVKIKISDGTLKDFNITKTIFTSEEGEYLGYIAIMSDITELKNKEKSLEKLASVDPLTKLYNRRYFSEMANKLLSMAIRENEHISLVMLDIDNFKTVNDTYGHPIGDKVIILISNTLLAMSRESDVVCRYGGEEFVMLLPKTDITGAAIIAEKIRAKVEDLKQKVDESLEISFTISLGISEINTKEEKTIEEALKRADDALYKAKKSGKNRVCYA